MSEFVFKVRIDGFTWNPFEGKSFNNGYTKTYYANNFNELKEVFINFIKGENRCIQVDFDEETKSLSYHKVIPDEKDVEEELIKGLRDMDNVSVKLYFYIFDTGFIGYMEEGSYDKLNLKDTDMLINACGGRMQYIASVRLVVKKDEVK